MNKDLYLLGDQTCLSLPRIAVVGTRAVSPYGVRMTKIFTSALVEQDWCIVSGLALGVDGIAHQVTLEQGGRTIAVLAHGLDYCYPPEHRELKEQILSSGGLLVSAYPEGNRPTREQFLERNELLVKLSSSVLVTCSPHRSGVKNTVKHAAEAGRDVFVIPGPIDDPTYAGTIEIIENGGIPVSSPQDLLHRLSGIISV
jgi:DNA processing protein